MQEKKMIELLESIDKGVSQLVEIQANIENKARKEEESSKPNKYVYYYTANVATVQAALAYCSIPYTANATMKATVNEATCNCDADRFDTFINYCIANGILCYPSATRINFVLTL